MLAKLSPVHFADAPLIARPEALAGAKAASRYCSVDPDLSLQTTVLRTLKERIRNIASTYWHLRYIYFSGPHPKLERTKKRLETSINALLDELSSAEGRRFTAGMSRRPNTRIDSGDFFPNLVKQLEVLSWEVASAGLQERAPGQPRKAHCSFLIKALVSTWEELHRDTIPQSRRKAKGAGGKREYLHPGLLFVANVSALIDPNITAAEIDSAIKTLWDDREVEQSI